MTFVESGQALFGAAITCNGKEVQSMWILPAQEGNAIPEQATPLVWGIQALSRLQKQVMY